MKTIIAEKPSVAREIARIVGATKREEGYFEGGGYAVTWAFGHLVQLAMPDGYGVRGFVRDNLPDHPRHLHARPPSGQDGEGLQARQRRGDADQDRHQPAVRGQANRSSWRPMPDARESLSSATSTTTRDAPPRSCACGSARSPTRLSARDCGTSKTGGKYDDLYLAAKARSESDWLVGINGTQALSIAAGHGTYSVGRVQTPTLAMVCARYWENRRFTPEAFWQLHIATDGCDEGTVKFSSSEKWKEKEPATELYNKVKSAGTATVTKAERKEKTEETPLLYDLTTLQKEANTKHGFTAEQTLEIAQKLYEKKLITYPRTGSRYIPEDVFAEIPKLLAFIGALPEWKGKVQPKAVPTRRSVDGSKVTDHHALLVTGEKPLFLSKEDNTVYQMVAGRMIEAFSEKCVKDTATVTAECAGVEFTVKGSVIRQAGWRAVYGEEDKEETAIPGWREGDTLTLKGCSITEGKTKPKPLHTEATLLSAMETAGKDIEDDALRQALKDCGIGTPATRAAIIETLFKRGYMERCKKSLVPTEKGLALYSVVKTMRIADVAMTGEWEKNLARIERGELPADTFCKEIEAYTKEITSELLSCDKLFARRDSGCKCPKCGTGSMQFYGKVVRCDNADCGLPVFRLKANRTLSDDEIKELLTDGHTKPLKGFKSKQGKSFDAIVAFDGDYNTTFVFPERKTSRKFSGRKK